MAGNFESGRRKAEINLMSPLQGWAFFLLVSRASPLVEVFRPVGAGGRVVNVKVVVSDYRLQAAGYRGRRSSISQTPSPFPARGAGKVGGAGFEPAKA